MTSIGIIYQTLTIGADEVVPVSSIFSQWFTLTKTQSNSLCDPFDIKLWTDAAATTQWTSTDFYLDTTLTSSYNAYPVRIIRSTSHKPKTVYVQGSTIGLVKAVT